MVVAILLSPSSALMSWLHLSLLRWLCLGAGAQIATIALRLVRVELVGCVWVLALALALVLVLVLMLLQRLISSSVRMRKRIRMRVSLLQIRLLLLLPAGASVWFCVYVRVRAPSLLSLSSAGSVIACVVVAATM